MPESVSVTWLAVQCTSMLGRAQTYYHRALAAEDDVERALWVGQSAAAFEAVMGLVKKVEPDFDIESFDAFVARATKRTDDRGRGEIAQLRKYVDGPSSSSAPDLWQRAMQRLERRSRPHNFEMWLRSIRCVRIDGSRITLSAPARWVREWFQENYQAIMLEALHAETNQNFEIQFAPDGTMGFVE